MFQRNGNAQETRRALEVATPVPGYEGQKEATTAPPHQSLIRDLRKRDCVIVLGLLTVLAALVLRELQDPEFAKALADRPLLSASVFTLLLSLMAYGGWNALRTHWDAERWRKLTSLAMVSMAHDITIVIDTCIWLVTGAKPFSSFTPPDTAHHHLSSIRTSEKCPEITDSDYGKINFLVHSTSLQRLTDNPEWRILANLEIERAKVGHRHSIARWVPSMMLHPTATDVLGRIVALNEFLSHLQDILRIPTDHRDSQTHKDLIDSWTRFLAEAMSLREDLWATSRGRKREWLSNRNLLPENIQIEMGFRDKKPVRDVVTKPIRVAVGMPAQPKSSSKLSITFRRRAAAGPPIRPARQDRSSAGAER